LRIAGRYESAGDAGLNEIGESAHAGGDDGNAAEERLDCSANVFGMGSDHGEIEVGVESRHVGPGAEKGQRIAASSVADAANALFILRGTIPGTADDDATKVGNSFLGDLKRGNEIFVSLEAGGLAEETFWGVHVADHADQGNVWWQVEFAAERAGAVFVE